MVIQTHNVHNVLWGHVTRGLGGVLNILQGALEGDMELPRQRLDELRLLRDKLNHLTAQAEERWS